MRMFVWAVVGAACAAGCGQLEVESVAAGGTRSCAATSGDVRCWGGRGAAGAAWEGTREPAVVSGLGDEVSALCAGDFHACARVQGGKVRCWGAGADAAARDVAGLTDVSQIACGDGGGCALTGSGDVRCWAWTAEGPGSIEQVSGLRATALAVGSRHRCAVGDDALVRCWGENSDGQLGVPPTTPRSGEPVQVQGLATSSAVAAGAQHSCALGVDQKVRCWGSNEAGQLGRPGGSSVTPVEVEGLGGVTQLAAGANHTCALVEGGAVRCWGRNLYGQLGDATTLDRNAPVEVRGLAGVKQVSAGREHTCALGAEGAVSCWGRNLLGQLGDGTLDDRNVPGEVAVTGE